MNGTSLSRNALLIAICSIVFALLYVQSAPLYEGSSILLQAKFKVVEPVLFRFLLPVILVHVFPHAWLDTVTFRLIFTVITAAISFSLVRLFAQRIVDGPVDPRALIIALFTMLCMHYTGVRAYNFYYVYDMPAMIFYMVAFLLLTTERTLWWGVLAVLVFSLSRETVIFAAFHAAGYHAARERKWLSWSTFKLLLPAGVAAAGVIAIRGVMIHYWKSQTFLTSVQLYEGPHYRLVSNLHHLVHDPQFRYQVFYLGCGLVIWLPFIFGRLSRMEKSLLLFSVPGLLMLNIGGNLLELRMYTECTPLIALLFARYLLGAGSFSMTSSKGTPCRETV